MGASWQLKTMKEKSMRLTKIGLLAAALMSLATPAVAEPKLQWELGGLKDPESAVVDEDAGLIYVSNINGAPAQKDGNGTIAQVSLDGKLIKLDWITGLDAPLGLTLHKGRLYAADIDQLVEIDVKAGRVTNRYPAQGAKFLNDVAAGPDGVIYVTDMLTDTIWRLNGGTFEAWLQSANLLFPNGLTVRDGKIYVAAWGKIDGDNFATSVPGHVLEVSLADKSIKSVGSDAPIGNLDAIEVIDKGRFLLTDWVAGGLFELDVASGKATKIVSLPQGTADIAYIPSTRTVLIPMMKDHKLLAYMVD
jgi:sugar lactone lactonase YvrE